MNLLAFDTSTEQLTVAVQRGARQWQHAGAGGRHSSAALIPQSLRLLDAADLKLRDLDAIVFGRGPGSFTGLRTSCSVAQGFAFGADVPVLPVDTLLAVAEQVRLQHGANQVLALLDARMQQVYAAPWVWRAGHGWRAAGPTIVCAPQELELPQTETRAGSWVLAGNALAEYAGRFPAALQGLAAHEAWPSATALLQLAPALLQAGAAVPAEQALPLYIRDKVAKTIAERTASHAAS